MAGGQDAVPGHQDKLAGGQPAVNQLRPPPVRHTWTLPNSSVIVTECVALSDCTSIICQREGLWIVDWINYIEHLQNLHLVPYLVRRG